MEPATTSPQPELPGRPLLGELVVRNGRLTGARIALTAPLTLIGQAAGCEVRLNVEGVTPLHAALVCGPQGFLIRDLGSATGLRINGHDVSACLLHHGAEIGIGPFLFGLELPEGSVPLEPEALDGEREALRIQAAAVVAQQAELTEEELLLQQQRTALDRQEEQLAAHLEERCRRLEEQQGRHRQERATLKAEREAFRREQDEARRGLTQVQTEAGQAREQARKEVLRLVGLRKRLKQRWRRHWHAHDADLKRREQKWAEGLESLRVERERLAQAQKRFNGEMELGRRQLKEEWQALGLAQQQWEECLAQEHSERDRRVRDLETRAAALERDEQALNRDKQLWQQVRANLRKEVEGLETRVRNQRALLLEQSQRAQPAPSLPPMPLLPALPLASPHPGEHGDGSAGSRRLAGELADQRWHLLEQWQRLLQVHDAWQQEREGVLADLESLARGLQQREHLVVGQEQALAIRAADLVQHQEVVSRLRHSLEGWQARLTVRETAWEAERAALLDEVREREDLAAVRSRRLEELRQRRVNRWRQDVQEVQAAWAHCEELRRRYASLWQECQQRHAALAQEQRSVDSQALALERLRQESLARSSNSAAAERRLEKLRRRALEHGEADRRQVHQERQGLLAEGQRLEERTRQLRQREEQLVSLQQEWTRQQAEREVQHLGVLDDGERRRWEMQRLEARHEHDQRQLAALREEVERIARLLLDEVEPAAPPAQAA